MRTLLCLMGGLTCCCVQLASAATPARLVRPDFNVDIAPAGTISASPAIAIDTDGRVGLVWSDNRSTDSQNQHFPDIWFRLDQAGVILNTTIYYTAELPPLSKTMNPSCAFDVNHLLALAWVTDAATETVQDIMAVWADPQGRRNPADGLFINQVFTEDTVDANHPVVGTDAAGQTTFLWSDNRSFASIGGQVRQFADIWGARLKQPSPGQTHEFLDNQDFRVNSSYVTKLGARHPRVAVNSSNTYIVVWDEDRIALSTAQDPPLRNDIFMRMFAHNFQFNPNASIVNDATVTLEDSGADHATYPDVAVAPNGRFLVVWQNTAAGGDPGDIRCRLFSANGIPTQDAETNVDQDPGTSLQSRPRVTALPDNTFLITWLDARDNGRLFARQFDPATETFLTGEFRIDDSPGSVISADVAADSRLNFIAVWHEQNPQDAVFANIHTCAPLGDLDGDKIVDASDLLIFSADWHPATGEVDLAADVSPFSDLDNNNNVNSADLLTLYDALNPSQPPDKPASKASAAYIKECRNPVNPGGKPFARPLRSSHKTAAGVRR